MDEQGPIVLDLSADQCLAGLAGEEGPRCRFPCAVSPSQKGDRIEPTVNSRDCEPSDPVHYGAITNWDDFEYSCNYAFVQLNLEPRLHPVLLSESPANSNAGRSKMLEIMFERFHCPGVNVTNQALLSLYSEGQMTGVILQMGEDVCYSVSALHGCTIRHATVCVDVGGWQMSCYMQRLLTTRGYAFTTAERDIIHNLRRKVAYVAPHDGEHAQIQTN